MVKNFLQNSARFFTFRQTDILSAAAVIMLLSLFARLLGLLRDRLLAHYFTADLVGIYFASFRLPDLAFQVLIFGALSVAFIPVFTEYLEKDRQGAWILASSLLNLAFILFLGLLVLFFIFLKPLSLLVVPGLVRENPAHLALLLNLTRILLFSQVFFVASYFLTGILQSFQRFLIPAMAAVFYNLGIILGLLFLGPRFGIYGAAMGAVLGAIFHFLVQWPLASSLGFSYKLNFNFWHPGVRAVGRLMLPRSLALGADQINLTVETILASLISLSAITFLNFAQHLALVPVGLFGATIAQASLPTLASLWSQKKITEFRQTLIASLHQILFLVIPLSGTLIVLHTPLIRLIFGAKLFSWEATVLTGRMLAFLGVGLFAQSVSLLLVRSFYALHDTWTPLKTNLLAIFLNILLSVLFILVFRLPVWGLGISASLAAIFNLFFLFFFLEKKVGKFERRLLFLPILKIFLASFLAVFFLWLPVKVLDRLVFDTTRTVSLLILVILASFLGGGVYLFSAWLLKIKEAKVFLSLFPKLTNWRKILARSQGVLEERPI